MKILVSYPWLELGGASNTSITLARGLKERGHEVYFFTMGGGQYHHRLDEAGIPVINAPHSRLLPKLDHLNPSAYRILSRTLDKYSIDIVHAYHLHSYMLSLLPASNRNIPVLLTAVWHLGVKLLPAYPGRVIFVAREFLDRSAELFRGKQREFTVIPNRVDLDQFRPDVEYAGFANRHDLPESGWKISLMTRVDRIKFGALRYAANAAEIIASRGRNITLAIAGDGPMFQELRDIAGKVNDDAGRAVIRLLGAIEETPEFLSWADIVCGIGRCAFEGMACGKPTLVVGENGLAGVVEPESVEELQYYNFSGRNLKEPVQPELLADAIEAIMSDRDKYNKLKAFSRQHVMDHYDYRAGVVQLEEIYNRALKDPPLTRAEQRQLLWTSLVDGYGYRAYIALKMELRARLKRDRVKE